MTNEEVVERVRKALYAALHAYDDTQAEVAIRGVGRLLAANLRQFNLAFAPLEPSSRTVETTRMMGEQIVELTRERGELQVTVARQEAAIARLEATVSELTMKLAAPPKRTPELALDGPNEQGDQGAPRRPPQPKLSLSATHRMILTHIATSGGVDMRNLHEQFALKCYGLRSRLSEMVNERHFGGPLLVRSYGLEGRKNPTFEITAHGRALLAEAIDARYRMSDQPADQGDDDE